MANLIVVHCIVYTENVSPSLRQKGDSSFIYLYFPTEGRGVLPAVGPGRDGDSAPASNDVDAAARARRDCRAPVERLPNRVERRLFRDVIAFADLVFIVVGAGRVERTRRLFHTMTLKRQNYHLVL